MGAVYAMKLTVRLKMSYDNKKKAAYKENRRIKKLREQLKESRQEVK